MRTVWVLGDQINRSIGALAAATPSTHRVLFVESRAKLTSKAWHIQRAHFVVTSMRRFADELRTEGFEVDYRFAKSLALGHRQHIDEFAPSAVEVSEPLSWAGLSLVRRLGCSVVRSNQFLCHYGDFAAWMKTRKSFKMEDFYRWQRQRLGYLMDSDDPVGGQWNFDADNREQIGRAHV